VEFHSLWPEGAPGAKGNDAEDAPAVQIFLPSESTDRGAAMVVCAGGGYGCRMDYEGPVVGRWLAARGIAGFVLRYRVGPRYNHPAQMMDAQRAVRFVRAHAAEWDIEPQRIGIMGFSAGGHLASTVSTHFAVGDPTSGDPVERVSSRPALQVLLYPVITMGVDTHGGSRKNLLGPDPSAEFVDLLSNEKHVTRETPPAFVYHSTEDQAVPVSNSDAYAAALNRAGVPCTYIRGAFGPHGGGVNDNWAPQCLAWLRERGFGG
jgi:acetyl esterase/lipase